MRTIALIAALALAGCSGGRSDGLSLKDYSLKDSPAKPAAAPAPKVAAAVEPASVNVAVTGGGLSAVDLSLAMGKELRSSGYRVTDKPGAWKISGSVVESTITWHVADPAGKPIAVIKQTAPAPGEIRGTDAIAAARAAMPGIATHLPKPEATAL